MNDFAEVRVQRYLRFSDTQHKANVSSMFDRVKSKSNLETLFTASSRLCVCVCVRTNTAVEDPPEVFGQQTVCVYGLIVSLSGRKRPPNGSSACVCLVRLC